MKFGTSGLRGLAEDLVGPSSILYAQAFAVHLKNLGLIASGDRIFIGRDFRASSPAIAQLCAAGVAREDMVPVDCGELPTPALANYAMEHGAACLMVTGSHIPENRNGIKFYRPDGEISKEDEAAIKAVVESMAEDEMSSGASSSFAETDGTAASDAFLRRNETVLPANAFTGLRVGVFEHSSVARDMLTTLLRSYGAETVSLGRSQEFVAVDTEAISEDTRNRLALWANDNEIVAIVSTDGDADRPLVADETGCPLRGDLLGLITAELLQARFIATPVTSNSGIRSSDTCRVIRTKVGSPYVIEAMKMAKSDGPVVGFEANGGFLLQTDAEAPGGKLKALPTRDCVLPILTALYTRAKTGRPLSQLADARNFPVAVADRLENFATERSRALVDNLCGDTVFAAEFFKPVGQIHSLDVTDGARFTLDNGDIIHYRPSGNAPELRCYCEAPSKSRALELLRFGLSRAVKQTA